MSNALARMQNSDVKPVSWAGAQGSTTAGVVSGVPRMASSASLAAGGASLASRPAEMSCQDTPAEDARTQNPVR